MTDSTAAHIPFSQLVDLVDGRLGAEAQAEIEPHLLICAQCAADVAWLRRVLGLMRADTAEAPPAHAVAAAKRLFRPPAGRGSRRQLSASLRFDSVRAPVAIGLRAGAQADRQLLFAAAEYLVDLRIAPKGALWAVSGQLLGAHDGEQVELRGPAWMSSAPLNDVSEFVLPPAPPGNYLLSVQLADLEITITGLELGA